MSGMSGRAARKLAKQAAGAQAAGAGAGALGTGSPSLDFDMLSQLMGDQGADPGAMPAGLPPMPGVPRSAGAPKPVVTTNKGTKKKKKGGRVTPPKGR
jgi:hypothetical protein